MIERHYYKDKLVRSYDFSFCFCMPNSQNSWEAVYDLPEVRVRVRVRNSCESVYDLPDVNERVDSRHKGAPCYPLTLFVGERRGDRRYDSAPLRDQE